MGARGPASAPAALKLLKGNGIDKDIGGRPVNIGPKFNRGAPDKPSTLSEEASQEWDRIVPGLDRQELLKPEDYAALVEHCETWATWVAAKALVRSDGITLVNPDSGRTYKNPALSAMEAAAQHLRASCREFGLTPSSEQNVGRAAVTEDDGEDPFGQTG
jgi:P27 family predicted phage terminase small subunit